MIQALIDSGALVKMIYTSISASIGIAVIFSTAILGAIRATDLRRASRTGAAAAYAALAALALLLAAAAVVYGLVLIAHKS
jgi:hypothetical protein